ncbi:hypothetical protein ABFV80_001470 [Vandammella animalimorsus]|uniref:hypothetical protein n=2 Tax=Vandammella animalimorsus TaxID=2029117 RepID=UPI0026CE1445
MPACPQVSTMKVVVMHKIFNYLSGLAFIVAVWVFGYKVGSGKLMDPQVYHANTVGSQIIQINDMYDKMDAAGIDVSNDRLNYNRDILTVIDCSQLLKSIYYLSVEDERVRIFKDGIEVAWKYAHQSKKEIVFCEKNILKWVSRPLSIDTSSPAYNHVFYKAKLGVVEN